MAVVYGKKVEGDWIKVQSIHYQIDHDDNGYYVDKDSIPERPVKKPGFFDELFFNINTKEFEFREIVVPLTKDEVLNEMLLAIRELTEVIRNK